MKIKEANKLIAEYMDEKVVRTKGYVAVERDEKEIPVAYHCKSEWLLPVLLKLSKEDNLTERLDEDVQNLYAEVVNCVVKIAAK